MKLTQQQLAQADTVREALQASFNYFVLRDKMNADIHLENPRYSPITLKLQDANFLFEKLINEIKT